MAEAPIFDIDEFLRVQSGAAPAQVSAPVTAASRAERFGRSAGRLLRRPGLVGGAVRAIPGTAILGEGLTGEPTVANAIRTGVGIGAIGNPAVGGPIAAGMLAAEAIPDAAYNAVLRRMGLIQPETDIRGPALRNQGTVPPTSVTPTVAPADLEDAASGTVDAAPVVPRAEPGNLVVPRRGTGFIRNNQTGATQFIDASAQVNAPVESPGYTPRTAAGNFVGAILGLKQIAGDNARRAATRKLALEARTQGATAARATAAGRLDAAKLELAERVLARGGSPEEAAAAISGRSAGGGTPRALPELVIPSASGPTSVPVFNPRTQTIINTPVQQQTQIFQDSRGPYKQVAGKKVYLTAEEQRKLQRAQ